MLTQLTALYCEPHRHYHNLGHIAHMFSTRVPLTPNQVMAIWFHDAIYQPGETDNEAKSAKLASDHIISNPANGLDAKIVETIILDTRTHEPSIEESKLVLDLDLMILAGTAPQYHRYQSQIRREYERIPDDDYMKGREQFLRKMQSRLRLFHVLTQFESNARENLRNEIARLAANERCWL